MIRLKCAVTREVFEKNVRYTDEFNKKDVAEGLMQDPSSGFYVSKWKNSLCCFFQTVGFEFIFVLE